MALAAAIRAGAGALVLRITPTSTFSAVRVWLLARERISVMDLDILVSALSQRAPRFSEIGWRVEFFRIRRPARLAVSPQTCRRRSGRVAHFKRVEMK